MEDNTDTLTQENLIKQFLNDFPEFKEKAEQEKTRWWNDDIQEPMGHIFFGDILTPFLEYDALVKIEKLELLKRIFTFLEKMANSGNEYVLGVLTASILEVLGDDEEILKKARSLMGKETLKLSHEVEKSWGRE